MADVIANKDQAKKRVEALKEEAYAKINEATAMINEATAIADKWGVTFNWDLAYGMGGTYYPQRTADSKWSESDEAWRPSDTEDGWYSSSQSC